MSTGARTNWSNRALPWAVGIASLLCRIPYMIRYDLHFGGDFAVAYLMAKRILLGEFPIFFWEQNYQGAVNQYLTAPFFAIFGPSIPLACFVTALLWAVTIGLTVSYVQRGWGMRPALLAGIALCVGVPQLHHYDTQPIASGYSLGMLFPVVFLWLAVLTVERGWTVGLCIAWGGVMGLGLYTSRQLLFSVLTVGLVMLSLPAGRQRLREFLKVRPVLFFLVAGFIGFFPELLHTHNPNSPPPPANGFASPSLLLENFYFLMRTIPAYFDGDPLARLPEGVFYLFHNENVESFPRSAADMVGIIAAIITVHYVIKNFRKAWIEKNMPVLLLAGFPLVNAGLVLVSAASGGNYYNLRRYIVTSSLILLAWLGIKISNCLEKKRYLTASVLVLMLGLSAYHQVQNFSEPDQLADYRKLVAELDARGIRVAASVYSHSYVLTALSNEKLIVAPLDYKAYPKYLEAVAQAEVWAWIQPAQAPLAIPERMRLFNATYVRQGESKQIGFLQYVVYKHSTL